MGQVLEYRVPERTREKRRKREAQELYRVTKGFQDPDPATPEQREMFEQGFIDDLLGYF